MARSIQLKRGFNISLLGEAQKTISELKGEFYAVKPTDFTGVFPRLLVKEGDPVKAGTLLFCDKANEKVGFASPVSGTVHEIRRGEKRVLREIVIKASATAEYEDFGKADPASLTREGIIDRILKAGAWPVVRQRPYNVIANPDDMPKAVFVSGFDSAPLAPDGKFILEATAADFKAGMQVLAKLTAGKVHLGMNSNSSLVFGKEVEVAVFKGPHPAGNVGVQIHHVDPINKGEVVWTVNLQDVSILGRLFSGGVYDPSMLIALTGSEVENPQYYRVLKGISVQSLPKGALKSGNQRIISGNVLTGTSVTSAGFLSYYHAQITVIPEGNYYEFFGWATPGLNKLSFSGAFFSKLKPGARYKADTNLHGGERALVLTGQFEKLIPMDILPMQLIKACIIEDIELMEKLGIYEVDEEDFALAEFADPSKTEIQAIIRSGLNLVRKEMS